MSYVDRFKKPKKMAVILWENIQRLLCVAAGRWRHM